jgi:hypothetical protein
MLTIQIDTRAFDAPHLLVPPVWTVRQKRPAPVLADVEGATRAAVERLFEDPRLRPGASVAVGVGSRGISHLVEVVRTVVDVLKRRDCRPFLVPAMGSHGGATAEGQIGVLRDYGVTADSVGAPVRATMDAVEVGALDDGYPVYFDAFALEADAVIVVNRIKPHTDFTGEIESGLGKMCAIGLGKQRGAITIHRFGADGLRRVMPAVARRLTETVNIVGGVALIENPYGQTAEIHGLRAHEIGREPEQQLLEHARTLLPRLPFDRLDVLVVDEMGKDIAGTGMDTHVLGRVRMPSIAEASWDQGGPKTDVRLVCALDLTDATHGNAAGLGLADLVTRRLVERIDFDVTNTNSLTSGEGAAYRMALPIVLEDAAACVRSALNLCGQGRTEDVRLARIRNTKYVDTFEVSEALLGEVRARPDLMEIVGERHPMDLDTPLATAAAR